tara:strand:- start:198 stop:482 length:285 start_codon:yes stop_codon:yes gene_type:complete
MINIYFICTTWCKSCPIIYNKIIPAVELLDKSLYNFKKIDMDSSGEIIEKLNITISKLPSLIIQDSDKCEIYTNENIILYFECINFKDDFFLLD